MASPTLADSSGVPTAWCNDHGARLSFLNDGEAGVTLTERGEKPLACGYGNGPDGTVINCDGWTEPKGVFSITSEPASRGRDIVIFENQAWYLCQS